MSPSRSEGHPVTGPATGDAFPVQRLPQGRCGVVLEIRGGFDETFRLKAMGICQGRRVMLLRSGDPLILRVFGSRIGLSARLADKIYVVAASEESCEEPGT